MTQADIDVIFTALGFTNISDDPRAWSRKESGRNLFTVIEERKADQFRFCRTFETDLGKRYEAGTWTLRFINHELVNHFLKRLDARCDEIRLKYQATSPPL